MQGKGLIKKVDAMSQTDVFRRMDTVIFMGGITALTAISVDVVLPATGVVARAFGVELRQGALLVSIYFIAYGLGQLFWGLFSDAFGRRLALMLSLSGFCLASFACAFAPDFTWLLGARFLQGLMGAAPIIARAMVRDVASGNEAARMMTLLGAILTVATMFAPVIGSGLLILFDWRAIFFALALLSAGFLAYSVFVLKESGDNRRPERFSLGFLRRAGLFLLGQRAFMVPATVGSLSFAGYATVGAVGAITVETEYGIAPQAFGALFTIAALSNTAGALLAGQMLKRVQLRQVGTLAFAVLGLAGLVQAGVAATSPSLQIFWGAICLYVFAFGMILPTSMAAALEPAGDMPGFAASLMGSMQMAAGALGAFFASRLYDGTHMAISACMAGFALVTFAIYFSARVSPK